MNTRTRFGAGLVIVSLAAGLASAPSAVAQGPTVRGHDCVAREFLFNVDAPARVLPGETFLVTSHATASYVAGTYVSLKQTFQLFDSGEIVPGSLHIASKPMYIVGSQTREFDDTQWSLVAGTQTIQFDVTDPSAQGLAIAQLVSPEFTFMVHAPMTPSRITYAASTLAFNDRGADVTCDQNSTGPEPLAEIQVVPQAPVGLSVSSTDVKILPTQTTAVFTVTLAKTPAKPVTVEYTTVNGNMVAPYDYLAQRGKMRFDSKHLTRTIRVKVRADRFGFFDTVARFYVTLFSAKGAPIDDGRAAAVVHP